MNLKQLKQIRDTQLSLFKTLASAFEHLDSVYIMNANNPKVILRNDKDLDEIYSTLSNLELTYKQEKKDEVRVFTIL